MTMKKITAKQLTPGQLKRLEESVPGRPFRHLGILKKLAKLGVVRLHEDTGMKVWAWGSQATAFYIDEADTFEVEGAGIFRQKYFPGCFAPYLIRAELDDRGRIIN